MYIAKSINTLIIGFLFGFYTGRFEYPQLELSLNFNLCVLVENVICFSFPVEKQVFNWGLDLRYKCNVKFGKICDHGPKNNN